MKQEKHEHLFSYRQDVLVKLFNMIKLAESGYIIGAASMGKSRLLDFMLRTDVQSHYLGNDAKSTLLVPVDLSLINGWSVWEFYELMLFSMIDACSKQGEFIEYGAELVDLDAKIIKEENDLIALRFLQLAVQKICRENRVCFIFDEYDIAYQQLPAKVFSHLRGIRDKNKSSLSYILYLRQFPSRIRPPADIESFYSLISHNMIGLGPYSRTDSKSIIQQLEERRNHSFRPEQRNWIFTMSGGHAGLIVALFYILTENMTKAGVDIDIDQLIRLPIIDEENRKIWGGLSDDEKFGMMDFIRGLVRENLPEIRLLRAKGLIKTLEDGSENIFSPIFHAFVKDALEKGGTRQSQSLLPERKLKVFLCHASSDKPFVRDLYGRLMKTKWISPWLDEVNLIPGIIWDNAITQEIKKTDLMIVCLSQKSINREGFVQKEIKLALDAADEKPEGQIFIVPLKIEECDVPARLARYHWLNYFDENAFGKLHSALKTRAEHLGIHIAVDHEYRDVN